MLLSGAGQQWSNHRHPVIMPDVHIGARELVEILRLLDDHHGHLTRETRKQMLRSLPDETPA